MSFTIDKNSNLDEHYLTQYEQQQLLLKYIQENGGVTYILQDIFFQINDQASRELQNDLELYGEQVFKIIVGNLDQLVAQIAKQDTKINTGTMRMGWVNGESLRDDVEINTQNSANNQQLNAKLKEDEKNNQDHNNQETKEGEKQESNQSQNVQIQDQNYFGFSQLTQLNDNEIQSKMISSATIYINESEVSSEDDS